MRPASAAEARKAPVCTVISAFRLRSMPECDCWLAARSRSARSVGLKPRALSASGSNSTRSCRRVPPMSRVSATSKMDLMESSTWAARRRRVKWS